MGDFIWATFGGRLLVADFVWATFGSRTFISHNFLFSMADTVTLLMERIFAFKNTISTHPDGLRMELTAPVWDAFSMADR
jgi:hypothetical protein